MSYHLTTKKIINEWTDYNNHMNLSYYILLFDMGAEQMLTKFNMGEHSAKTTKMSTICLLYTSPSPRDISGSRMPSSA